MNTLELIAKIGADYIEKRVTALSEDEGTTRFLLDGFLGEQVAAFCEEILSRPTLAILCHIRVPKKLVEGFRLPEELMTDEKTTYYRNAPCEKPVLILANTDDAQGQSLKDITTISSIELLAEEDLWIKRASEGTGLTDDNKRCWGKALKALQVVKPLPLGTFSSYILQTRQAIIEQGLPIIHALGWAFPSLQAPRDSSSFIGISSKHIGNVNKWKKIYSHILNDRAPYLKKITPKKQMIETEQLQSEWDKIRDEIRDEHVPKFEDFIRSPQQWTNESQVLAELEWNADRVFALFEGLKRSPKTQPLGKSTIDFFEEKDLDVTEDYYDLLRLLDKRKAKEANDDEVEFYESHRMQLLDNSRLKARWDKYVFGAPIECHDFCIGILEAVGRLFEQAANTTGKKLLRIEANKKSEKHWIRDHSKDSMLYFVHRYKGIEELFGKKVQWDLKGLFNYEEICSRDKERRKDKFRRNTSTSKVANQIKFNIYLIVGEGIEAEETSVQVIWKFNSNSVCSGFARDWKKIIKNPFCHNEVTCETVSAKGQLQFIDLTNVNTMMPIGGLSRGCLVSSCKKDKTVESEWLDNLKISLESSSISQEGYDILLSAWKQFSQTYKNSLQEFWDVGLSSKSILEIEKTYIELLDNLHKHALGDWNRHKLWVYIVKLGAVRVEGPIAAVIIPPWHPLRMLSMVIKAYQVAGLIHYLLDSNVVTFGDQRLFFGDLCYEIAAPYYPEVAIEMHRTEPVTLIVSDYYADYTLMEPAIKGKETTSENPKEITKSIKSIVQRYIELQPHERANLSIVLYNSDSARLPEETVKSLSDMYEDEEEVRCQVVLRHRDKTKLASLYQTLIQNADEQDIYLTSESYKDFMARLRIGILADDDKLQDIDGPPTDLVFLHNVIAGLSKQNWQIEPDSVTVSNIFEHFPPRLSRRKPASKDEEKSTVYLACSAQPEFGWLYFKTLQCIMNGVEPVDGVNYLPTLEINFRNNDTRDIFEEVHKLGQWVVNYDYLLERRQLRNQGVQIIRFRHAKHGNHNIVISSKAPLNLLDLMIIRRLKDVMAGVQISDQEFKEWAIRMREDANKISGDIVLRAAKRGKFVSELIGLVLSRFIIETEIGKDKLVGWFLLDDYAQWFGQKEEQLADIMAISPSYSNGEPIITILISESKYIDSVSITQSAQGSANQLYETVERIQDALFGTTGRLDRDLWLSRIADMMIDGIEIPQGSIIKLPEWRKMICNGEVKIVLKGYSHVFVHAQQPGEGDPGRRSSIRSTTYCWQEVFGKDQVQQLLVSYKDEKNPLDIRKSIDESDPWNESSPKQLSDRIKWSSFATKIHDESEFIIDEISESGTMPEDISQNPHVSLINSPGDVTSEKNSSTTKPQSIEGNEYDWAREGLYNVLSDLSLQVAPMREDDEWLEKTVKSLRQALLGYRMQANLIDKRLTPNAALAIFKGSDLLTASGITAHRSQLLTVHSLDVKNIIPEPGRIIVTVARPERQTISLLQMWQNRSLTGDKEQANLKLIVGAKEYDGETLYLEPAVKDAPHTLIAGTTGSGKSVLIQNLILDIACTNTPQQAHIYLIDPKLGLDYAVFRDLPHLRHGIVTNQNEAASILQSIVDEMQRRMTLITGKASNVIEYNKLVPKEQSIPILWLIHDEFAAWMIDDNYKDLVSNVVQQLSMMARAAGIFLIFAAQRPEARVMTAQLRSNLDNRLILRVSSEADSEMALGERGAEQLLGKGHLVARLPGGDNLILAQVPFLERHQAEEIVKNLI